MKALVVYFSRTGNCRKTGTEIASQLGCDMEEIKDTKKYDGAIGYMRAGRDAMQKRLTKIRLMHNDPKNYDIVIVGTPIWGWTMTPAVRTFLSENSGAFKKTAFYCTMGSSGDEKAFAQMAEESRRKPIATMALRDKEIAEGKIPSAVKHFVAKIRKAK